MRAYYLRLCLETRFFFCFLPRSITNVPTNWTPLRLNQPSGLPRNAQNRVGGTPPRQSQLPNAVRTFQSNAGQGSRGQRVAAPRKALSRAPSKQRSQEPKVGLPAAARTSKRTAGSRTIVTRTRPGVINDAGGPRNRRNQLKNKTNAGGTPRDDAAGIRREGSHLQT